ncbi:MAG: hypothetical protein K9L30_03635 [Desulfobacterales bacterium]|nr:hypothetical protein [Desulfobacterales bacterium]
MKQKFVISKTDKATELTIREMSELYKDTFTEVFEATYDLEEIKRAAKESQEALIAALRTQSLYPINDYMMRIANGVTEVLRAKDAHKSEIIVNDAESLPLARAAAAEPEEEKDSESAEEEVDELLDEKK